MLTLFMKIDFFCAKLIKHREAIFHFSKQIDSFYLAKLMQMIDFSHYGWGKCSKFVIFFSDFISFFP